MYSYFMWMYLSPIVCGLIGSTVVQILNYMYLNPNISKLSVLRYMCSELNLNLMQI